METTERTCRESVLRGFLMLISVLLITNNLLRWFGLRDDSGQTIFSSLEWAESENNHLFMPQRGLRRLGLLDDVHVTVEPPPELDGHYGMSLRCDSLGRR